MNEGRERETGVPGPAVDIDAARGLACRSLSRARADWMRRLEFLPHAHIVTAADWSVHVLFEGARSLGVEEAAERLDRVVREWGGLLVCRLQMTQGVDAGRPTMAIAAGTESAWARGVWAVPLWRSRGQRGAGRIEEACFYRVSWRWGWLLKLREGGVERVAYATQEALLRAPEGPTPKGFRGAGRAQPPQLSTVEARIIGTRKAFEPGPTTAVQANL